MTSKPKRHSQQKWDSSHPVERWAHSALRSAVRRGLVVQQPCVQCGDLRSEGHHPDYTRPAHVIWLCRKCHQAEHRRLKAENCNGRCE